MDFDKIFMNGDKDIIKDNVKKYNIDVNYEDGYYLELIAGRNNIELFEMMVDLGSDIRLNNYGSIRLIAHEGYLELFDYVVVKYKIDCKFLLETTAGSNYKAIKDYINNLNV